MTTRETLNKFAESRNLSPDEIKTFTTIEEVILYAALNKAPKPNEPKQKIHSVGFTHAEVTDLVKKSMSISFKSEKHPGGTGQLAELMATYIGMMINKYDFSKVEALNEASNLRSWVEANQLFSGTNYDELFQSGGRASLIRLFNPDSKAGHYTTTDSVMLGLYYHLLHSRLDNKRFYTLDIGKPNLHPVVAAELLQEIGPEIRKKDPSCVSHELQAYVEKRIQELGIEEKSKDQFMLDQLKKEGVFNNFDLNPNKPKVVHPEDWDLRKDLKQRNPGVIMTEQRYGLFGKNDEASYQSSSGVVGVNTSQDTGLNRYKDKNKNGY